MQELARKFTKDEIIPKAAYFDKTGEYPMEIVKKAHAVGLMNGHVPQECGKWKTSNAIQGTFFSSNFDFNFKVVSVLEYLTRVW